MISGPRSYDEEPRFEQPANRLAASIRTIDWEACLRISFSWPEASYGTLVTAGGFQLPSRIDSFGGSAGQ